MERMRDLAEPRLIQRPMPPSRWSSRSGRRSYFSMTRDLSDELANARPDSRGNADECDRHRRARLVLLYRLPHLVRAQTQRRKGRYSLPGFQLAWGERTLDPELHRPETLHDLSTLEAALEEQARRTTRHVRRGCSRRMTGSD